MDAHALIGGPRTCRDCGAYFWERATPTDCTRNSDSCRWPSRVASKKSIGMTSIAAARPRRERGVARDEPTATFPKLDAGAGLISLLFPKGIQLAGDQLAELTKRPN